MLAEHYHEIRFLDEKEGLPEAKSSYKNVGWSLGNACPLHCTQCYSRSARESGQNLSIELIDRIVDQLAGLDVGTINLGGNEPIFTNGLKVNDSLLPYILEKINKAGIKVGITTAGPTLNLLEKFYPEVVPLINDVDVSLDSPFKDEHEHNRGQKGIYGMAMQAIEVCKKHSIPRSIIMCGMNWNFTPEHINAMIDLAIKHGANFRINPMKPIEPEHMKLILTPTQFYGGLQTILQRCEPIDLSDPAWATAYHLPSDVVNGCPCGTNSFRIHSITPDGKIPVSPCVYLHDYKAGDLTTDTIEGVLESVPFKAFRRRKANPQAIDGCETCPVIDTCGGGCASRAYLHKMHEDGDKSRTLFAKDPYCPEEHLIENQDKERKTGSLKESEEALVHLGYLCTGIFQPKDS
jgi:radical SAM protein with 4Fe4S-binding SPASM domain